VNERKEEGSCREGGGTSQKEVTNWKPNEIQTQIKALFGWQKKVRGKKVKGMIVKGKKIKRKWVESEMIIWLFGMSESGKKIKGKKDMKI
jgi:hypothetical protein